MHQLIDKKNKIVIYLLLLLILSTTSNKIAVNQEKNISKFNMLDVRGMSNSNKLELINKLDIFFYKNIFILRKSEINRIISKYNIIEEYNIKKIYPSKLDINIKSTKFTARISGENQLLVGMNGKIISNEKTDKILPYIFGEFNSKEFLELQKNIDQSKFSFKELKSIFFYPSNRFDIITIDNILIKLPENDLLNSLNLAHKIITDNQFKDNKLIDLRISKNLVIK
jgi:cell division protein FtsQ